MKHSIHHFTIQNVHDFVMNHQRDASLTGFREEHNDDCVKWSFPSLDLQLVIDKDRLIASPTNGQAQIYLWSDLLQGHPVRPPMLTIHQAMYSKRFQLIHTSFGDDVGAWRRLELPGFIMMSVWDALLAYNSKRNHSDHPPDS